MKQKRLLIGVLGIVAIAVFVVLTRANRAPSAVGQSTPAIAVSPSRAPGTPGQTAAPSQADTGTAPGTAASPAVVTPPPQRGSSPNAPVAVVSQNPPFGVAPEAGPIPRGEVEEEIEEVQLALRDFRTRLGGNPVGNNAEITKTLLGDNLKQVKIPVPSGAHLNGEGELCDRWGTPYFFHQMSATRMEIRSAGPDRKMWSADDVQK